MIERIDNSRASIREYISARKPCIITAIPEDLACFSDCLDLSFMSRHAGHLPVSVEPISSRGTFGTAATKTVMPFAVFLEKLKDKEKVYLTTQYDEDEDSAVLSEPLLTLRNELDFPLIPAIADELVTAKINIWLGTTVEGTSSGLHHDFHDNFYSLLSGEKRFRIFRPSWKACKKLQIHGKPHEIFDNGLISYDGSLCSDGLTTITKAQLRVDVRDRLLAEARSTGIEIEQAESLYEAAMDELLEAKLEHGDGSEDGDFEANAEFDDEVGGYEDNDGEDEEDEDTFETLADLQESRSDCTDGITEGLTPSGETSTDEPASFSSLSSADVKKLLEDDSLEGSEFVLRKGEILYLPASYFHEVISMSGQQDFHMAVNYWFYPPDSEGTQYQDTEIMRELRKRLVKDYPLVAPESSRPAKKRKL